MKEIIYKPSEENKKYITEQCTACGNRLFSSTIPCPDGKGGCLVIHYGYICDNCGRIYQ